MNDEPKLTIVATIPRATHPLVRRLAYFTGMALMAPVIAIIINMLLFTLIVAVTLFCGLAPFFSASNPGWVKRISDRVE